MSVEPKTSPRSSDEYITDDSNSNSNSSYHQSQSPSSTCSSSCARRRIPARRGHGDGNADAAAADDDAAVVEDGIREEVLARSASRSTTLHDEVQRQLPHSMTLGHTDTWSYGDGRGVPPHRRQHDWVAVANFHFGWFGASMSTGMVGCLLVALPYQFPGLHYLAIIVFVLTLAMFVLFAAISIVRYAVWPRKLVETFQHPTQSLTMAFVPLTMGTLINMTVHICSPVWGSWVMPFAWALWWIHVVISVAVCAYIPWLLFTVHDVTLDKMTAAWMLPAIAAISSSSAGGVIADYLPDPNDALITITASYVIWGFSVPLAFIVIGVYFHRLALHSVVSDVALATSFTPIGAISQGAFSAMKLGHVAKTIFPRLGILQPMGGEVFYVAGAFVGQMMWGTALLWLWFALASFATGKLKYNLGWWSMVFPTAVFVAATIQLGREFDYRFYHVLATISTCLVVIVWIMVFSLTTWKSITREIFSP